MSTVYQFMIFELFGESIFRNRPKRSIAGARVATDRLPGELVGTSEARRGLKAVSGVLYKGEKFGKKRKKVIYSYFERKNYARHATTGNNRKQDFCYTGKKGHGRY
jgi:hypothetical protein